MSQLIRVLARFVLNEGLPPSASLGLRARLYDQDLASDDLLGEEPLAADGSVAFNANLGDASSWDSPGETQPDLYVVLLDSKGAELFRSPVVHDMEFLAEDPVTGLPKGLTIDLGTFRF